MLLNSARQLRGGFKSPVSVSRKRASLSPSPPTNSGWLSSQPPGGRGPLFISREWLKVPGRRCRLLSLWEMVGDISETMQSPVCGVPGLSVLEPPSPGSKAVALDQGLDGSGRRTERGAIRALLTVAPSTEPRSQSPGWRPRRCPGRWPSQRRQRCLKESPGHPRRARGWRRGPWCHDGNGPLASARPNGQSPNPPPVLAATTAADSTFSTGLQRDQVTSCVEPQEVVLGSNESCPRLQSKPIRACSRDRVRKQPLVGTRNSGDRDLMGGLTLEHFEAWAGRSARSASVSACGRLESVGLGHWARAAT